MEYNEKQVQIMETAEILFAEKGFNGTSVRDIAEKANVNLAMVSYYFGSKDKLLEALFGYRGEYFKLKLETMIEDRELTSLEKMETMIDDKELSSLEKMNTLIDHYIEKIMQQQCFSRIMVREQVLNHTGITAELIFQMKKKNQELISKLIHQGQKKGEFKKNIDIPLMMATLIGTANNLVATQFYYRELNDLQSMSEEEFQKHLKKKLSQHLKKLFKAILTNEE
ncbi:MAG: TetR/AcrR family transcriptional regulator [Bacteroidetes bacterium]|nr:MAG: TetR/AcrR family transcriptional regulator [Bacteroidota bacterium]